MGLVGVCVSAWGGYALSVFYCVWMKGWMGEDKSGYE